jgi:hypothetical protein
MAVSGTGVPGLASASASSAPNESIPAKEPIGFKRDLAAKEPSTPLSISLQLEQHYGQMISSALKA